MMTVESYCLSASELLYLIVLLWMLEWQTLLLLIEGYLYANSSPFRTIPHQLAPRCQKALQPNFDETTRFSFFCLFAYQFAYSDYIKESRKVSIEKLPLKNYCQWSIGTFCISSTYLTRPILFWKRRSGIRHVQLLWLNFANRRL